MRKRLRSEFLKKKLTLKLKIVIGVAAFALIMGAIIWIIALALLDTDIKTEVYGAEFDYVGDAMYDNAYITMKGGKWQLYRGGDAISRAFGQLEYSGEGRFYFINTDGKGWGYVRTDGSVEIEFGGDFEPLIPSSGFCRVAVKTDAEKGEFIVRNYHGKNEKFTGKPLFYSDFENFYEAFGDSYVAYTDKDGKFAAVDTADFKTFNLPFSPDQNSYAADGFLTVGRGTDCRTYGSDLREIAFLAGLLPSGADNSANDYYYVVGNRAVSHGYNEGRRIYIHSLQSDFGYKTFETLADGKVLATDGNRAVFKDENDDTFYFDGNKISKAEVGAGTEEITGGAVFYFKLSSTEKWYLLDIDCNIIRAEKLEFYDLKREKEKNRAYYLSEVRCVVADGKLYEYENGKLELRLENVTAVVNNELASESRIITQTSEKTEIFDAFFRSKDRKTNLKSPQVIDAYLPAYAEVADGKKKIILPRGEIEVALDSVVEIRYCTDEKNFFVLETLSDGRYNLYKNRNKIGEFSLKDGESISVSQSQLFVVGENKINIVSKGKEIPVKFDDMEFSRLNSYAVAIRSDGFTIIDLNDGSISDERRMEGGVEITEKGENTFAFRNKQSGLYGIIDGGKVTLSPTFRQMKLHDGFVIASVDGKDTRGDYAPTYFQADFYGKRLGKIYAELQSTEGLTMGKSVDGSIEVMNNRGRVILKDVTFVPEESGGFAFMKSYVYDEDTGETVAAYRRDKSRLLAVTAGGCKRVISISFE